MTQYVYTRNFTGFVKFCEIQQCWEEIDSNQVDKGISADFTDGKIDSIYLNKMKVFGYEGIELPVFALL